MSSKLRQQHLILCLDLFTISLLHYLARSDRDFHNKLPPCPHVQNRDQYILAELVYDIAKANSIAAEIGTHRSFPSVIITTMVTKHDKKNSAGHQRQFLSPTPWASTGMPTYLEALEDKDWRAGRRRTPTDNTITKTQLLVQAFNIIIPGRVPGRNSDHARWKDHKAEIALLVGTY
jgi:hypothetical protein